MKEGKEALKEILEAQKKLLSQYEQLVLDYEQNDSINENKVLKNELNSLKASYEQLEKNYQNTKQEAQALKWTLQQQINSERLHFIESSEQKVNIYFKDKNQAMSNQLTKIEQKAQCEMSKLSIQVQRELQEENSLYIEQIEQLRGSIEEQIKEKKQKMAQQEEQLARQTEEVYRSLKEQPLTEEILQKRIKANNMEVKIGLNWISKVGMLLILIGFVSVMRYSFTHFFSAEVKGAFGLLVGILFLLGGEYSERKEKRIFSQVLIGGGIGIFYLTVFSSYFILHILNIPMALFLSVLISITTFVLCIRYNSKTIACMALIGGYLPLLAYSLMDQGIVGNLVYWSMLYVLLLNSVTLWIGIKKEWVVVQYLSFATNMPIAIVLAWIADDKGIGILYSFINFLIYLAIILVGPFIHKVKLRVGKVIVVGLNTVISCSVVCVLFKAAGLEEWMGLLALVFCLTYYGLSLVIDRLQLEEKGLRDIFHLTALTFAILMIPMQFGSEYLVLGWLIEGILLIVYGLRRMNARLEMAGKIILGLCVGAFYCFNPVSGRLMDSFYYVNYTSLVAGLVIVLAMYIHKYKKQIEEKCIDSKGFVAYKYITLGCVWLYLLRMGRAAMIYWGEPMERMMHGDIDVLLFSLITAILLSLMKRWKWLYDASIKYVVLIGFIIVDLICFINNINAYIFYDDGIKHYMPIAIVILILWNVFVLINLNGAIKYIVVKGAYRLEAYPLALAVITISNITLILCSQFEVGLQSVIMSIFYIISAIVLIICGFKFGYRWIRYGGLGLSLFALGKLFLFDFSIGVSTFYKMISYFCFGMILLGISYLYQKYSKKLERELPTIMGEKSNE